MSLSMVLNLLPPAQVSSSPESPSSASKSLKHLNASRACNACKKRKGKCEGNPCSYCVKKKYVCEFSDGKKRGPAKKMKLLPKGVQECEFISVLLLKHIQESLNSTYQQHNFIDFYFQYIGRAIPKEFKHALLSGSTEKLNNELTTQLYIISGHIMKFFGNTELENQCINKAHKYASNLFNSDTIDSVISLMMMAAYLGDEHPKTTNYLNLAFNIAKLPSVCTSAGALKARIAIHMLLMQLDKSVSQKQRYQFLCDTLVPSAADITSEITPTEWAQFGFLRMRFMLVNFANFTDFNMPNSLSTDLMNAENRQILLDELERLSATIAALDNSTSYYAYATFVMHMYKLIIEWRSGNTEEALAAALNAMAFYKDNKRLLGLWFHNEFDFLLPLPYFFQEYGAPQMAREVLQYLEESFVHMETKNKFNNLWKELCTSASNSMHNTLQIELLGTPENTYTPASLDSTPNHSPPFITLSENTNNDNSNNIINFNSNNNNIPECNNNGIYSTILYNDIDEIAIGSGILCDSGEFSELFAINPPTAFVPFSL